MLNIEQKKYGTACGDISYWTHAVSADAPWLVFLPGLSADHRLFDKQIEHFAYKANILVWDAPSHGESRPFLLNWSVDDLAEWLHGILESEGISHPVLVGQSLGGCIAQAYMDLYPGQADGLVSIDSFPMQLSYTKGWELWFLKHTTGMFKAIPWKLLVDGSAISNSTSAYGRELMKEMVSQYGKQGYAELAGHGFRAIALAIEEDRSYRIDCPALIICGEKDGTGFVKSYNKKWEKREGYPVRWIPGAGHNANCDNPDAVNSAINDFLERLDIRFEE